MEWNLRNRILIYGSLFLSGTAGLIYQVVWHRYLGILLGAQAKATAIILAIFLGGISFGYAVFGRWSRTKSWNLLLAYSLVELGLAVWAFLFPNIFQFTFHRMDFFYGTFGIENYVVDVILSVLLLGLPTFLMGGTLPLLTQGLSAGVTGASRTHALIYGFNTVGACLGCLVSGYFLIPGWGYNVTSRVGGFLNLLVAALSYFFFARKAKPVEKRSESTASFWRTLKSANGKTRGLWLVGFLSGFYVITLETILIRLVGLSIGSSNYNFTLIVALFIFGLGIGSLFLRSIERARMIHLLRNQTMVSLLLMLVYLSVEYWPYAAHVMRVMLRDIPQGFYVFQFLLAGSFFILLTIPLSFTGITLPLCFHLVKEDAESLGEKVGQLYSLNTVGCVLGAVLGGYFALNYFDLDGLYKICILLCLVTALVPAYFIYVENKQRFLIGLPGTGLAFVLLLLMAVPFWNRNAFIQPFRHPNVIDNVSFQGPRAFYEYLSRSTKLIYWKDGPNTSLAIGASEYDGKEVSRTVFVNGKSDGNTRGDFFTTVMLAHIPALLTPVINNSLVIGLGTGMTVGTLAQYDETRKIDVVEISNFTIKKADYFDKYNFNVSLSPKVKFHEMDAFRFLQGTKSRYDVIISEPSNPWVSGIENLYSQEFYEIVQRKLSDKGTFVQWIHTYSFNEELFRLVMSTITQRFSYVSVFQLKGGDFAILCRNSPIGDEELRWAADRYVASPWLRQHLFDSGIDRLDGVFALEVMPHPLAKVVGVAQPVHTLTSPLLSNEAAKAFFVGSSARVPMLRRQFKDYLSAIDGSLLSKWLGHQPINTAMANSFKKTFCDQHVSKTNYLCEEVLAMNKLLDPNFISGANYDDVVSTRDIASLAVFHEKFPSEFKEKDLHLVFNMFELYKKVASPIARIPIRVFVGPLEKCIAQQAQKSGALYGECLLQKLLVLENLTPESEEVDRSIDIYQRWFKSVPKSIENYAKFEEANTILKHMKNSP